MRNPGGQFSIVNRDGSIEEIDTFTCCHCQALVKVPPRCAPSDMGGYCTMCAKPTCKHCNAKGTCTPFEKWLDKQEASARFRRAIEADFDRSYPRGPAR